LELDKIEARYEMTIEHVLDALIAGQAGVLALLIKHMFDCRSNSARLTRIEQFLKDKLEYRE
jgi:hypothetical protein